MEKKNNQLDELRKFLYEDTKNEKVNSPEKLVDKVKEYFRVTFSLSFDNASPEIIEERILKGTRLRGTNMAILALSIIIASVGLNTNSTAVIIGAMLISPLMGSILGIAYGFVIEEMRIVRFAALCFAAQIIIAIGVSSIYFAISPLSSASSELLARTHPNILDVIIAICGGLAGAIGITRSETNNVVPGVAIATALMPPLCTVGYGIATLQLKYVNGALYLFFINSFYIAISMMLVLKIIGITRSEFSTGKVLKRARLHLVIVLIITIVPSFYLGSQIMKNKHKEYNYKNYIVNETEYENTALVSDELSESKKIIRLVFVGDKLTDAQRDDLKSDLINYNMEGYKLNIIESSN